MFCRSYHDSKKTGDSDFKSFAGIYNIYSSKFLEKNVFFIYQKIILLLFLLSLSLRKEMSLIFVFIFKFCTSILNIILHVINCFVILFLTAIFCLMPAAFPYEKNLIWYFSRIDYHSCARRNIILLLFYQFK